MMNYECRRLIMDEGMAWARLQKLETKLGMDNPETIKTRSVWAELSRKMDEKGLYDF